MKPYISKIQYARIQSEVFALAAGPLELDVNPSFVHSFAGLVFFNDAEGITPVQPSAGEAVVTIRTTIQPHVFQTFPLNVIDVSLPGQIDWASNTEKIRITESVTIVGATHWRVIWAGNSA